MAVLNGCATRKTDSKSSNKYIRRLTAASKPKSPFWKVPTPQHPFTAEIKSIIESQINKMPEPMRQIFLYNRFEGKTYQEIAEITGINVRNVTANIQRALAIMRIALNDYLIILIIVLYSSVIRYQKKLPFF